MASDDIVYDDYPDDEDSTDHLTRCECCGVPIGEEEEMVTSEDGDLTLHRRCYEEAHRDNWG